MTTQTATLTDFLLTRIAEDEAEAIRWQVAMDEDETQARGVPAWVVMAGGVKIPARVLAECEAKRRIISHCDLLIRGREYNMFDDERASDSTVYLVALALPFADHPDYDESWRP